MSALDLYNNVALLVGGPQPDASGHPDWWSGAGGVTGVTGCFSLPPTLMNHPITGATITGIVGAVGLGQVTLKRGNPRIYHVRIPLWIVIQTTSGSPSAWATMAPYEDLIPDAFETHMALNPAGAVTINPPVLEGFNVAAEPLGTWERPPLIVGGSIFIGWRFTLDVDRTSVRTMT